MLIVESIRKIRQAYHRDKKPIRQIAREFHVSRNTVKKIIRSDITEQVYQRSAQPRPRLSQVKERDFFRSGCLRECLEGSRRQVREA